MHVLVHIPQILTLLGKCPIKSKGVPSVKNKKWGKICQKLGKP